MKSCNACHGNQINYGNSQACFSLCFSLLLLFSPKCVIYIFFPASLSHLYADPLSVLSAASGRGRMEVCAFLLERGSGLEIPNRRGMVPLLSATKHGHTQVRNQISGVGFSSLTHFCLVWESLNSVSQVAELLLKQGADINVTDKLGRTALILAASEGHVSTAELLLSKGQSPHIPYYYPDMFTECNQAAEQHLCCLWSQVPLCPLLIRKG